MSNFHRTSRPLLFLYIIFTYVIAFSLWWAYLLHSKNKLSFDEMVDIKKSSFVTSHQGTDQDFYRTAEFLKIEDKFKRQKKMVFSEGTFFIGILVIGFLFVRRSLVKELQLANRQKNFLLSITHELKSPLASIKLVLQTLLKRDLEEDVKVKFLHNSLYDAERLEGLVENILLATKFDNDSYGFVKEEIELSYLMQKLKEKFDVNQKAKHRIQYHIEEGIFMMGDKTGLTSLIVNLIENAIKYSAEETPIFVALSKEGDEAILEVKDQGFGISEEEKEKIFDKFYRVGNEETRQAKGTGLGLYIVKNIVNYHQGSIKMMNNTPVGMIFRIGMPLMIHDLK